MKHNKNFTLRLLIIIIALGLVFAGCDSLGAGTENGTTSENETDKGDTNENETVKGDTSENETDKGESGNNENNTVGLTFTPAGDSSFNQGKGTIYSDIYDITYGNSRYVAVGIAGQMAYSSDGSAWTAVENTGFNQYYKIKNITYGGGKFVAIGTWGNVVVGGQLTTRGNIVCSSDGIYWTSANTSNFDSTKISCITYGNNKFVAVSTTGQIVYSVNGTTWTPVTNSTFGSTAINGIAYGADRFVAVGGSGKIAYSSDGIIWTALITSTFNGIIYGSKNFIAWGNGIIASSSDGTTWTPLVNTSLNGIVYGAGKFVSWNGHNINYSVDNGVTWVQVDSTLSNDINSMVYGNGRFIAAGRGYGGGGQIAYSNKQE